MTINAKTVAAYVNAYPHLQHLAARLPDPRAIRTFAQNACRLAVPPKITARQVLGLSALT